MAEDKVAPPLLIEEGDIVLPDRLIRKGALLVVDGKITAVGSADRVRADLPAGCTRIRAEGLLVCPSLWEVHIHGCGGVSMEGMTGDSLAQMGRFLAARGVGAFLPTAVANESMLAGLGSALETAGDLPDLRGRALGIHVEGPFVAPVRKGGIPADLIREPSIEYLQTLADIAKRRLRVMTFAPELPGASELFDAIVSLGILPSLGHSDARFSDLDAYENITPLGVTHLFNGMSGISHKDPGLAQWAILNKTVFTELNCDGTHVHDAAVKLALRIRPWQRIILISDAFPPAGLEDGKMQDLTVYGKHVVPRGGGVYYAESGVLVGSRMLVSTGVSRLISLFGVPLPWAVAMASLNPARHLGFLEKGALLPGYDADVAIFSRDFGRCSFLAWEGRTIYQTEGLPEKQLRS
ncbi:MAG: N-acetylglucosamine-6-phosphate deacetylase [Spirochaetia bacterium]